MATVSIFGIDLGTTNSAVAYNGLKGVEIIPIKRSNYIPSAVAVDKRGDIKVGEDALNPHLACARWFKRLMGSSDKVDVGNGILFEPEKLSSEVLKALKSAVKLKTNELLTHAVITVPAMFNQPQCAATKEAASLAGITALSLLQEPIAAATAYLSDSPEDGFYLVYDLGGGTFDVSIVRLLDGEMSVVGHGGDNHLGGADFDLLLFDWILGQIKRHGGNTHDFLSGSKRHQLLILCEEARHELSIQHTATMYLDDFELPLSKIEITRVQLEMLLEERVTRTISIAQSRLLDAGLKHTDIVSVLLVGGPTQMPYIRDRLQKELQVRLNLSQDPMTVVAKGAAIHASTILIHAPSEQEEKTNQNINIELFYETVSPEKYVTVSGKVVNVECLLGEIRICRTTGDWATGWAKLTNGAFSLEVMLSRETVTNFQIEMRNYEGTQIEVNTPTFCIRSGVRAAQALAPYNYGVVAEDSSTRNIITAGDPLPVNERRTYELSKGLVAGSSEKISFYFVEGNSSRAEENLAVGSLNIYGTDIKRSLRTGEKIEVTIKIDESRLMHARVYVPILDADFDVEINSRLEKQVVDDLKEALEVTKLKIGAIESFVEDNEQDLLLQASREMEQLEAIVERAERGELGESLRIHSQLSALSASIRPLRDKYELLAKSNRISELIQSSEILCDQFSDAMGKAKLNDIRKDLSRALELHNEDLLGNLLDRTREIFWTHYGKTRECWEYQVKYMRSRAHEASDPLAYHDLVRKMEECLEVDDFRGVDLTQNRALMLLPSTDPDSGRFTDASIR